MGGDYECSVQALTEQFYSTRSMSMKKKNHNLLMGALVYRIAGIARSAKESGQFIHLHTRRMMQACVYHLLRDKQAPLEYDTEPVPKAEDGERPAA